jgi:hypothetical protein
MDAAQHLQVGRGETVDEFEVAIGHVFLHVGSRSFACVGPRMVLLRRAQPSGLKSTSPGPRSLLGRGRIRGLGGLLLNTETGPAGAVARHR